jgi:dTDP-glucose 4,6-dehydratase
MNSLGNVLVTGGCGFIGSNFINVLLKKYSFGNKIINIDRLSYASNNDILYDVDDKSKNKYVFIKEDICNTDAIIAIIKKYNIKTIFHFAAESHVDNSIESSREFIMSNIVGTWSLVEAIKRASTEIRFIHVSTDEVYGQLQLNSNDKFTLTTPYKPRSPYSASKASSDHIVYSYFITHGLDIVITHCSNNYGCYQHTEKLIPKIITSLLHNESIPIYGDGKNIRDWIHAVDHCEALLLAARFGKSGETYNIGGDNEVSNIDLVKLLIKTYCSLTGNDQKNKESLITFVSDRPGHDARYAIDSSYIHETLGWKPSITFLDGIISTILWYMGKFKND